LTQPGIANSSNLGSNSTSPNCGFTK
jgi:hypothetical protein